MGGCEGGQTVHHLAQRSALSLLQLPLPLCIPQQRPQLPHTALGTAELL